MKSFLYRGSRYGLHKTSRNVMTAIVRQAVITKRPSLFSRILLRTALPKRLSVPIRKTG